MSTIGLYDLDLWHATRAAPCLELMKTYNYFNSKGHKVILMQPKEDEGRFSKIIYFKESPALKIPNNIIVYGDKKDVYGYGFYKKTFPLKPEIAATPPSYDLYDLWAHRFKKIISYEKLKSSSYIRFELEDFTDYKSESKQIVFADHDFLYLSGAEDFLQEHKNKNFYFFQKLEARDSQTAERFLRYSNLIRNRILINFDFTEDFFYNNYYEPITFILTKKENETEANYLSRYIKMALWYKKNNLSTINLKNNYSVSKFLSQWIAAPAQESFYEYYKSNKKALLELDTMSKSVRLLLKQNPKTITKENLGLRENL